MDNFIGEIRQFGGNFAPSGWALCNGQLLAISEYDALFALIGTTYGGDGASTFALPNLQSRVPLHQGTGAGGSYVMGQAAGQEQVTLTTNQLPVHSHPAKASSTGGNDSPAGNVWGASATGLPYGAAPGNVTMNPASVSPTINGNQPHSNMQPYLVVTFIIALFGIFPSRS